ncbi:hypothetical protein [Wukongibacter sp. M2B1]|uniref:hypothetical protein n=1 Tax=Wukongibacter sp. M2B1 TaxID=3088895 RepID=UPI003D7B23C0
MKKLMSILLVFIMIASLCTTSFANEKETFSIEKAKQYLKEKGIKPKYIRKRQNSRRSTSTKRIKINSVEELEGLIEAVKRFDSETNENFEDLNVQNNGIRMFSTYRSSEKKGNGTVSKWAPLLGSTLAWKNVSFDFKCKYYDLAGYYIYTWVNDDYITSHISGIVGYPITWNHTSGTGSISSDGRSVSLQVTGYYVFGIDVGEWEMGVPINGKWKLTSKKPEKYIND